MLLTKLLRHRLQVGVDSVEHRLRGWCCRSGWERVTHVLSTWHLTEGWRHACVQLVLALPCDQAVVLGAACLATNRSAYCKVAARSAVDVWWRGDATPVALNELALVLHE